MSKLGKDLPTTLRPELVPPSNAIVRGWFSNRWFTPNDNEIADFAFFLRRMAVHAHSRNWHLKNGLDEHSTWQKAIQTLKDDLPAVISEVRELEKEFGDILTTESRSSQLARLFLAAQEVYLGEAPASASIDDEKNDHAAAIANYVNGMAKRAGKEEKNGAHRNSPLVKITASAMEACGFAGAVNAEAIAADFKLKGLTPKLRRKAPAKGKKT